MNKSTEIKKLFVKVSDSYTITNCQNGFMVEISGQDSNENWINAKFVFKSISEVKDVARTMASIQRA